ncbi:apc family amino acid-polyamine-organocation transporter [Ligilactobacillus ceti DSM 22408]|uniref:Apc family amino acid-polyamine-organocation transporter n=2 Tax=Ligilactobacillus TaxID=2767887 RepID=A0A0R2KQ36_9LACO|nr:apc family amino acid-polyamine-organocation transporter [Ligilactobacillus ceti DSM 22408]
MKKRYIAWPVLALMDFVTVIGFDDIIYNFKNQGLGVVTSWIIMLFVYVLPYELIVGNLGSAFSHDTGGMTSWVKNTSGKKWGYICAWFYWVVGLPYIVDVANSMVVSFGWLILGNNSLEDKLTNSQFALATAAIFLIFIWIQHHLRNSLEILSIIGGGAMFIMSILFVLLTFVALGRGGHVATQPFNVKAFIPHFDLKYLSTLGLLIFAMNGAELVAPYVSKMKDGKRDFPRAMIMLAIMTAFLTVLGSFSLGVFFNSHHLPADLKMNGSYYAFLAVGKQFGWGKTLMYVFAVTQAIYMAAQLAVLLDAGTRMFLSDTAKEFLPKRLTKVNSQGLPINGYWLTTIICVIILVMSATLPHMNDIFNWLLDVNGIVSPFSTCFLFWAFIKIRLNSEKYPSEYVFIKNDKLAVAVGIWCFVATFICAAASILPSDAAYGTAQFTHELILNITLPLIMTAIGITLPLIAKWERRNDIAS